MRILIIEDDKVIRANLVYLLQEHGYAVDSASTGEEGKEKSIINEYDVIVLDWMLPDIDGNEVCNIIRKQDINTPIIFLTAKDQVEDKVEGLDIGADDYVTKPFDIDELLARIRVQIRRNYKKNLQSTIEAIDIIIDTSKCEVSHKGKILKLSPKEYDLLEFLAMNTNKIVSRMDIMEHIWDENADLFSNVIDVHIKNLRKTLRANKTKAQIKTIKTKGYMLCTQ